MEVLVDVYTLCIPWLFMSLQHCRVGWMVGCRGREQAREGPVIVTEREGVRSDGFTTFWEGPSCCDLDSGLKWGRPRPSLKLELHTLNFCPNGFDPEVQALRLELLCW